MRIHSQYRQFVEANFFGFLELKANIHFSNVVSRLFANNTIFIARKKMVCLFIKRINITREFGKNFYGLEQEKLLDKKGETDNEQGLKLRARLYHESREFRGHLTSFSKLSKVSPEFLIV